MGCGCSNETESSGTGLVSKHDTKIKEIAEQMAVDCLKKYAHSNPT